MDIVKATSPIRHSGFHRDLNMEMVLDTIKGMAQNHKWRIQHHPSSKAIQLHVFNSYRTKRLKFSDCAQGLALKAEQSACELFMTRAQKNDQLKTKHLSLHTTKTLFSFKLWYGMTSNSLILDTEFIENLNCLDARMSKLSLKWMPRLLPIDHKANIFN